MNQNAECRNNEVRAPVSSKLTSGKTASYCGNVISGASSAEKREKFGLFTFFQKLKSKNKPTSDENLYRVSILDVSSLPSSPQLSNKPRCESIESVLSTTSVDSFSFLPANKLRNFRNFRPKKIDVSATNNSEQAKLQVSSKQCVGVTLRSKYNLQASEESLVQRSAEGEVPIEQDSEVKYRKSKEHLEKIKERSTKRYSDIGNKYRLSFIDTEPISIESDNSSSKTKKKYTKHRRAVSEASDLYKSKPFCHRPGKRRAPQPPQKSISTKSIPATSSDRKKRKAPQPPVAMDAATLVVSNDSLKLEKGILKQAKSPSNQVEATSPKKETPVSPKPWYKRNVQNFERKKTEKAVDKYLEEWMLESGLPRSSSFYEKHRSSAFPKVDDKRRSQISILANISELDREAAEIIEKEHKREREMVTAQNEKFYSKSFDNCDPTDQETEHSSRRTTAKELISFFNVLTNVTKVTVNTSFFNKDTSINFAHRKEPSRKNSVKLKRCSQFLAEEKHTKPNVLGTIEDKPTPKPEAVPASHTLRKSSSDTFQLQSSIETEDKIKKPFSNWVCPKCTLENPSWKFICEACNKWRPYTSATKSAESSQKALKSKSPIRELSFSVASPPKEEFSTRLNHQIVKSEIKNIVLDKILKLENTNLPKGENARDMEKSQNQKDKKIEQVEKMPQKSEKSIYGKLNNDTEGFQAKLEIETSQKSQNSGLSDPWSTSQGSEVPGATAGPKTTPKDDIEEIRKARLVYFDKKGTLEPKFDDIVYIDSSVYAKNAETSNQVYDNEERQKLRDILKDLKNSLPKKQTPVERTEIQKSEVTKTSPVPSTSGHNVPPGQVHDYSIKDGVLMTASKTKDKKILGNGTYELIQEKDFNLADLSPHTYVNAQETGENSALKGNLTDNLSKQLIQLKHLAETKENVRAKEKQNMTTLAINRLLKKLQTAIASGQHHEAANLARELARLKVHCNVTRLSSSSRSDHTPDRTIVVNMYVEDKVSHKGPIPLKVNTAMTLEQLKDKVRKEFEIPVNVQRWILGNQLAVDDSKTLEDTRIGAGSPVFLYLVAPENSTDPNKGLDIADESGIKEIEHGKAPEIEAKKTEDAQEIVPHELRANSTPTWNESEIERNADFSESDEDDTHVSSNKEILHHDNNTSTLVLGWKCDMCTLINSPTRPGCLACSSPRPDNYVVPHDYVVNQEETDRLKMEEKRLQEEAEMKLMNYQKLMDLESADLIANMDQFDCSICIMRYNPGDGVVLHDCLHVFCRECLIQTVRFSTEAEVRCPYRDDNYACESVLQEREIKSLVSPEIYEQHLARSITEAENKIRNAFHCKSPNCHGWCIFEDNVNEFRCPVCNQLNCLTCRAIHAGLNCKQYQEFVNFESETNIDARRTKDMLQDMVEKGDAMTCPTCQVILMKKWGCDWLRCSMCKTEICWVTRGPRWGPLGKGDTTGGCQCGVNGIKCHPRCNYCH